MASLKVMVKTVIHLWYCKKLIWTKLLKIQQHFLTWSCERQLFPPCVSKWYSCCCRCCKDNWINLRWPQRRKNNNTGKNKDNLFYSVSVRSTAATSGNNDLYPWRLTTKHDNSTTVFPEFGGWGSFHLMRCY